MDGVKWPVFLQNQRDPKVSSHITNMTTEARQPTAEEPEKKVATELVLPASEQDARNFENLYVHTIYNDIADHFSSTRHKPWPGVVKFIESMAPYSSMLDIGCGNGKYLNLRNDVLTVSELEMATRKKECAWLVKGCFFLFLVWLRLQ